MRRIGLVVVLALAAAALAGCGGNGDSLRPYGIAGYQLYTGWIARSPYWTEGVPRMTTEQEKAFAVASWSEHERVYDYVADQFDGSAADPDTWATVDEPAAPK